MPSLDEMLQALRGAIGIALGDENAMRHFEVSTEAFFRSFFAFIPALPFYLLITTAEWRIISEIKDLSKSCLYMLKYRIYPKPAYTC